MTTLYQSKVLNKAQYILSEPRNPLFKEFKLLLSGSRYSLPSCRTKGLRNSLIPIAIGLLNIKT